MTTNTHTPNVKRLRHTSSTKTYQKKVKPTREYPLVAHLAEDCMLLVEMRRVIEREEKLAVIGAGLVLVGHGHLPAMVELDASVNLVSKGLSVDALSSFARARGISALNHELPNDPVEHRVVVVLIRG